MVRRQAIGTVLMGLLLVTAGCNGLTGGDGGAGDGGSGAGGEVDASGYTFVAGESYTYAADSGDSGSSVTFAVESVEDGDVTVNISAGSGQATTVTAPQEQVFNQSREASMTGAVFVTFLRLPVLAADGQTLEEGNSWTVGSDQLSMGQSGDATEVTVEVTGTDTVAGQECYTTELSAQSQSGTIESCVRADWPFALAVSNSGGSGDVELDISVDEFERP